MLGSFVTRGLVLIFGYVYPAYECYKTVERNKPNIEDLLFWCRYWMLMAAMMVVEKVFDTFVSWVPMYSEAKLAFIIYLWHHRTKGTTFVYDSFFKPYVAKHEPEIDRNLLELKTRAGDILVMYWQKAGSYAQTRVFDILQFVAAQSTFRSQPAQAQHPQAPRARQPAAAQTRPSSAKPQPQVEEPPSPTSSTSSSQYQEKVEQEVSSSQATSTTAPKAASQDVVQKKVTLKPTAENSGPSVLKKARSVPAPAVTATATTSSSSSQSVTNEAEGKQIVPAPSTTDKEKPPPATEDTLMEEAIRVTRGRLRKTRSTAAAAAAKQQ